MIREPFHHLSAGRAVVVAVPCQKGMPDRWLCLWPVGLCKTSVCLWLKHALLVCRTASSLPAEHLTKERPVLLVLPSWELLLASGSHRVFSLLFPTTVQTLQHSSLPESPLQLRDSKNKQTYIHTHAEHRKPKNPGEFFTPAPLHASCAAAGCISDKHIQ